MTIASTGVGISGGQHDESAHALVFDDVEVEGRRVSVRVSGGRIVEVGASVARSGADDVIDGRGGALIPGLHDHHVHLAATAALARSVVVGPPDVRTEAQLRAALAAASAAAEPGAWLRAVGYHYSVAGDLDRTVLDRLVADRPVRVQDATGARWTVNTAGLRALGLEPDRGDDAVERDVRGRPTGRLRSDGRLRDRLSADGPLPFSEDVEELERDARRQPTGRIHRLDGRLPADGQLSFAGDVEGVERDARGRPAGRLHRLDGQLSFAGDVEGVERDASGRPTGRLHRLDGWLRDRLSADGPLPFAELGRRMASYGISGVTDTTPSTSVDGFELLAGAVRSGALRQRITVTGGIGLLGAAVPEELQLGPVKVIVDDGAYPGIDDLVAVIVAAHGAGRPVAFHAVTRVALTLVLAALDAAGPLPGDRIEHGSVITLEHLEPLRHFGLTVVTQPCFIAERGDRYLAEVDPDDVGHLYRCGSLLAADVPVAAGSDAPYACADPWRAIAAAADRSTPSGAVLGAGERITAAQALALFLGTAGRPGGPPRRVRPRAPADLCLLHVPLAEALARPSSANVRATLVAGRVVASSGR